jgi:uncharacterized protein (DUF4415 family)
MSVKPDDTLKSLGSDLPKLDAHVIQPEEYDEIPELTGDELLDPKTKWFIGEKEVAPEEGKAAFRKALKRGRPKAETTKVPTTLRLDADVLEAFKATGKGWQTRINHVLREWVKKKAAKRS